jgi:hypothetical protein
LSSKPSYSVPLRAEKLISGKWNLNSEFGNHGDFDNLFDLMDYVRKAAPVSMELIVHFDDGGEKLAPVFVIPFDL